MEAIIVVLFGVFILCAVAIAIYRSASGTSKYHQNKQILEELKKQNAK